MNFESNFIFNVDAIVKRNIGKAIAFKILFFHHSSIPLFPLHAHVQNKENLQVQDP